MDYLKWILHCIKWQTHGTCVIEAAPQPEAYEISLKFDKYNAAITPERIMRIKDDDNAMKAWLAEIKIRFEIDSRDFIQETFEMVRETSSPLYYQFLEKECSPWR